MSRFSPVLRNILISFAAASALLAQAAAYADDATAWQSVKKAGVLRCGAAVVEPYVVRDPKSGNHTGFFSALCRDFGEKVLKVKVEFVDTTWDNIIAGLQSGKWDLSMALNDTPEREKAVLFSTAATDYEVSLAYNTKNPKIPANLKSVSDLDKPDLTFVVTSGTAQDKTISGVIKQATIMRLPEDNATRLALISKRADLLVGPSITNMMFVEAHHDWAMAFTPKPALAPQAVAFGLRKDTPQADLDVLNSFLKQQVETGAVNRLIKTAVKESVAAGS